MTRKTSEPLDMAVTDLIQAIGLLVRRTRAAAATQEISMTESVVMARLERDGAATTADLARAEGMRPQSMGATVTALEKMGLIQREPHPTDGRQMNIELTAKGVAFRRTSRAAKRMWLAQVIGDLDPKEQATLFEAGEIIKRLVKE